MGSHAFVAGRRGVAFPIVLEPGAPDEHDALAGAHGMAGFVGS
jgi:hypothetical protein